MEKGTIPVKEKEVQLEIIREKAHFKKELLGLWFEMQQQDSLEIGTAGKGGCVKIYGNFSKTKEFREKIDAAFAAREYANSKIGT